ncbi:hypothetical protein NJBCHELONAE_48730 [Mycobacteroides chelonae]|uniref:DUF4031 domain-containing protein n=1 Tax=Mycobacteroides chelonae TaxID=1774 RepID=UPI0021DE5E2B|nr:DUF4031 domain-containing protein [Mycobacteroides chelonae]GLE59560.1 hypothetical protein NJBCHELONAE_48730 [Mycobacteroides chelonae]
MTVYVDDSRQLRRAGRCMVCLSALLADTDGELHEFAKKLGLKRDTATTAYAFSSYPITEYQRKRAIKLGAQELPWGSPQMSDYVRARMRAMRQPSNPALPVPHG